ncbi:MAG: GFA family protein [Paracoccaceae bacterium]|nr:GFA family protein [Paracoccaceae bacterium]MDG2258048.1 GFA family protein [Paracoccaceae bacterium]
MLNGSCHCGAVSFEIGQTPEFLLSCNCSICRRLSTLWVYSDKVPITLHAPEDSTIAYTWGDKMLAFHSCKTCGCTTHWASLADDKIVVNSRLCPPDQIKDIRIRHFDGADSWQFLD